MRVIRLRPKAPTSSNARATPMMKPRHIKGISKRPLARHWMIHVGASGAACGSVSTNYTNVIAAVTCPACRIYHAHQSR
jgi:hypothetical protein